MAKPMRVHDGVYDKAKELSEERGITIKEALRDMVKEAGYDV